MSPDVIVVGGGIAGCACADRLASRGLDVLLLERGALASGATGRNQGGLLPSPVPACGSLYAEAVAYYRQVEAEGDVPFGLREHGYLLVAQDEDGLDRARSHGRALTEGGFASTAISTRELLELEPGLAPDLAGAVAVQGAHALHPVLAAAALAARARRAGAVIRTNTPVRGLLRRGGQVTGVITDDGALSAGAVVLAAGPWSRSLAHQAGSDLPVFGARGWLVRTAPVTSAVFRHTLMQSTWHGSGGLQKQGLPLLTEVAGAAPGAGTKVVFSLQPLPGGDVVLGSSSGPALQLDDAQDGERTAALIVAAAARHAPALAKASVRETWAGVRPMSPDGLPVVGPAPGAPGLWFLSGYGIDGMPLAPGTSRLLADHLVDGHCPPQAAAFSPGRFG